MSGATVQQSFPTLSSAGSIPSSQLIDDSNDLSWKTVLLLQFQSQVEVVVMVGIFFAYICAMMDIAFACGTKVENIPLLYEATAMSLIYAFDVIYVVDILSMICYKNAEWAEVEHLHDQRHAFFILLDIISVIPIDAVYYYLTNANMRILYFLRARYTFRIIRFLLRIRQLKNSVGYNQLLIEVVDFLANFILILITISCVLYIMDCKSECNYKDGRRMIESFYIIAEKISSRGYVVEKSTENLYIYFLLIFSNILAFIYVSGFTVGLFLLATLQKFQRKLKFDSVKHIVANKIQKLKVSDVFLLKALTAFFSFSWANWKGIIYDNANIKIIPEIMVKEINLDVAWDALNHSHLFRKQEVHFLRYVSTLIKQRSLIPGEPIYKRGHYKSSMVYVVSGVIQILSEKDGESPVLSLSGGTCLGDSTLLIDYISSTTVVCQNYCEVYIIYRKDFIKAAQVYPQKFKELLNEVRSRYSEAREYQELLEYSHKKVKQKKTVLTLKWLKMTLRELMQDSEDELADTKTLNLEERKVMRDINRIIFCCKYLDTLVITEQIQLITDTVFLHATCPWILQPDSFIVVLWRTFVILVILIFAFVYPYFASFQPNTPTVYYIFSYIVTITWWLDIYIQLSTAIKTKDEIITRFGKIFLQKARSFKFFMDVIASIPMELFVKVILQELKNQNYVLLQSLRLLKLHRLPNYFEENPTALNTSTRNYLKYFIYMLLLLYYSASLMHLILCYQFNCDSGNMLIQYVTKMKPANAIEVVLLWCYLSSQLVANLGLKINLSGSLESAFVPIMMIDLIATLFYIFFLSSMSTTEALNRQESLKMRQYTTKVMGALRSYNVNPVLCSQVEAHIRGQAEFNGGLDLIYPTSLLREQFHSILLKEAKKTTLVDKLKSDRLFSTFPDEVLADLVSSAYINILVPGEVITYSGEICKEIFVIMDGYCEVFASSVMEAMVIGPGSSISLIEICLEIPVINNVVTLTHCSLCCINRKHFMKALNKHPEVWSRLKNISHALAQSFDLEATTRHTNLNLTFRVNRERNRYDEKSSFKNFGYYLDKDSKKEKDFHEPFDKLGFFGFLRFLFLRHTIRPYGKFIKCWEISRCIFAFLAALFWPITFINSCGNCSWLYFLYFLDAAAWIDIYLRHHICYFDERGLEISHPLKTAAYYWKHGFIVDLLGVFPFEIVASSVLRPHSRQTGRALSTFLRILQTHRIIEGINYLDTHFISSYRTLLVLKFIPIMLLLVDVFGSLLVNVRCVFNPNIKASDVFTQGVRCKENVWISTSDVLKPITPLRVHLYGAMVISAAVTGSGLGGFTTQSVREAINLTILTLMGYWLLAYIISKIISNNIFRNADLTTYQETMRHLVKFLECDRLDINLRKEVINHFEYIWLKKKGKNLHHLISSFHFALQEDILLGVYGKVMKESTVFLEANDSFFRSLLLDVNHEIIMKRGIISRVNDINKNIYFVFKGHVEVLGPDYNKLLILPPGSIFGNIDDCLMSRQTLTMVAKGHVEVLTISSVLFHQILSKYPRLKAHFYKLIVINNDYIINSTSVSITTMSSFAMVEKSRLTITSSSKSNSKFIIIISKLKLPYFAILWETLIISVCYVSSVLEIFHMAVHEHSYRVLVPLYILDFLFVIHIYRNFVTPYEDEYGVLVSDRKQIAIHYIKNVCGFPSHLAAALPLEICALFFLYKNNAWLIWSYCRCNRYIKIYFIIEYLKKRNQQLNINIGLMRTVSVIACVFLLLMFLASFFIITACHDPENSAWPSTNCNWKTQTFTEKLHTYSVYFSRVLYIFTAAGMSSYIANSPYIIILLICYLITIRFVTLLFIAEIVATLDIVLNSRLHYEYDIRTIKEHMERESTSPTLSSRVRLYVMLLWERSDGQQFPALLLEAPYYLREAVLNSLFGGHLRKHPVFQNCHVDLIRQVAAEMRTLIFFPEDYIAFVKDIDECMYFIHEGGVDVLSEDTMYKETIEQKLRKGDMFGFEQGVYPGRGHDYTYRANKYTVIIALKRNSWIHLLHFYPASRYTLLSKART